MLISDESKKSNFARLVTDAQACSLCADMNSCTRVLTDANGSLDATVLFIGEAPGRLGAERTAIPFHGDVAGENFEKLITLAGLWRNEVFVTNSILCNPTDERGNNAPPKAHHIRNCSSLLRRQIETINPAFVVTLGAKALQALNLIEEHKLSLSESVRSVRDWFGRRLIPLYHPGARAMIHRNFLTQTADYYFVGEQVRRAARKSPARRVIAPRRSGWPVVEYLLSRLGEVSLFRLHKILYLIDYSAVTARNQRVTDFFYIRQKDGPYCVELGSKWYKNFDGLQVSFVQARPVLRWKDQDLFSREIELPDATRSIVDQFLDPISALSERELKTRAYLTGPMKRALRAEKAGQSGLNRALL